MAKQHVWQGCLLLAAHPVVAVSRQGLLASMSGSSGVPAGPAEELTLTQAQSELASFLLHGTARRVYRVACYLTYVSV